MKNTAKKTKTSQKSSALIPQLVNEIEASTDFAMSQERQKKLDQIKAAIKAGTYSPDIMKVAASLERELFQKKNHE